MPFALRFCKEVLRNKRIYFVTGILSLVITALATTLLPRWLERGIAILKHPVAADQLSLDTAQTLGHVAWVMIGLGLVLGLFRTLSRILIFIPGRLAEEEMRQRYFGSLTTLPPSKTQRFETGDLISRGTSDVSAVRVMVAMGTLHSVNSILMLGLCLYHMIAISPRLTALCLLPVPLGLVFVRRLSKAMMGRSREMAKVLGAVSERVREIFGAHTLLSISPAFGHLFQRFAEANNRYQKTCEKWMRLRITTAIAVGSVAQISQWLLLIIGGHLILNRGTIQIESLVAFSAYLALIQDPARAITWIIATLQRGEACLERLYDIIDAAEIDERDRLSRPIVKQTDLHPAAPAEPPLITIRNLDFRYRERAAEQTEPFALQIQELRLDADRRYGLFGPVGCGKTTLINILSGNLPVPPGSCFYRGHDYTTIDDVLLRRQFSLAPQESRHFAATIRANIERVAENPAYHDHVQDFLKASTDTALSVSCLQPDIASFPKGMDALLGEQGINLSGGQRQRLSLLRALVKPHRVLVLDDVISSVDHRTEDLMLKRLYPNLLAETCLIFISHRISALIPCDEILLMDAGRIVDRGSHQELLERQASYRHAFEHQALEQKIEDGAYV